MPATKSKQQTVVYQSRARNLRVLVEPEVPAQYNQAGGQVAPKKQEKVAVFRDHRFVADEQAAREVGLSHEELVQRLQDHSGFGESPGVGEFFEVPSDVAAPDPTDMLQAISTLAAAGDREGLELLLLEEREGWGRQVLIETLESAIGAMESRAG